MKKLWSGGYGLAATFWLWWFVGNGVMTAATTMLPPLGIVGLAWYIVTSVAVWKAGTSYQGSGAWTVLSRICLFAVPVLGVLIPLLAFGAFLALLSGLPH